MRTRSALIVIAVFALCVWGASGGCAVDAGSDPVVVTTEKTTATAFDTIDTFLKIEHENRAAVAAQLPAVHAFAEKVRKDAPAAFREVRAATAAYKASRATGDGTRMDNALLAVQTLARQARQYLLELETKGVR
jgi:hypothetical protein